MGHEAGWCQQSDSHESCWSHVALAKSSSNIFEKSDKYKHPWLLELLELLVTVARLSFDMFRPKALKSLAENRKAGRANHAKPLKQIPEMRGCSKPSEKRSHCSSNVMEVWHTSFCWACARKPQAPLHDAKCTKQHSGWKVAPMHFRIFKSQIGIDISYPRCLRICHDQRLIIVAHSWNQAVWSRIQKTGIMSHQLPPLSSSISFDRKGISGKLWRKDGVDKKAPASGYSSKEPLMQPTHPKAQHRKAQEPAIGSRLRPQNAPLEILSLWSAVSDNHSPYPLMILMESSIP